VDQKPDEGKMNREISPEGPAEERAVSPRTRAWTRAGVLLPAAAVIFLCLMTALYLYSRPAAAGTWSVETQRAAASSALVPAPAEKLDLNAATAAELETLPGIGATLAKRIVEYREAHGNFKNTKDIEAVKGIGEAKYAAIADLITVG